MQIIKMVCLFFCFVLFLSSCTNQHDSEPQSTTTASATVSKTTEPILTKSSSKSSTTREYEKAETFSNQEQKIFFDYECSYDSSNDFLICFSNPDNEKNYNNKDNRYGIADKKEKIIVSPQFTFIAFLGNDRFRVENTTSAENTNEALINTKGEFIIPYCKGVACLDTNNYMAFHENDIFYFLDNSGDKIYDNYFKYYSGRNINYGERELYGIHDGKLYVFDCNLVIKEIIDETPVAKENFYTKNNLEYCVSVCFKNDKTYCGIINKTTGKEIVPCKYDEIIRFANDRILASSRNEEPVITSGGSTHYGNTIAIYDFYGNVLCPEGEYCDIEIYDAKFNSDYGEKTYRSFEAVGVASAYNPNGDRIYGSYYEWLIDKNGTKISDKYYNVYGQIWESHDERIYTADRGDRVFYLNKYGKVVSTIGQ